MRHIVPAVALLLWSSGVSDADRATRAKPWAGADAPATGAAASIGGYSNGCVRGAKELPATGDGYQVMRPSRNRDWGHPQLVDFIRDLGARMNHDGLGVLLVADLGQPRGGPAPSGHASHQTGLDADLWYWYPKRAAKRPLRPRERESITPRPVARIRAEKMTRHWSPRVATILQLAAEDERVARIFVNPLVKRAACKAAGDDRNWLRKLRPWWGHHRHFHVRLACPDGSPDCEPQSQIPEGDGCAAVDWWLDDEAQAARKKGRTKYRKKLRTAPTLPAACQRVLDAGSKTP